MGHVGTWKRSLLGRIPGSGLEEGRECGDALKEKQGIKSMAVSTEMFIINQLDQD